jgi:hypothetical protein
MNQHMLPALARQHTADLYEQAAGGRRTHRDRTARPSLRTRTGWTLVDLGLRLVSQPAAGLANQPRPAESW